MAVRAEQWGFDVEGELADEEVFAPMVVWLVLVT